MTWFKVDDSFHSHPKVLAADPAALGLWVIAGSWCGANTTDGFVPAYVLVRLLPNSAKLAAKLVTAGLWETATDGYRFRDWHDYNPTAEEEKKRKSGNARRQADWRERSNAARNALRDVQPTLPRNDVTNDAPSRPVPKGTSVGGESLEPAGRENDQSRPPERCSKHTNDLDAPPCGACANARRLAEAWDANEPRRARDQRLTIRACGLCDADGWRLTPGTRIPATPYARCDHTRTEVNA
jgi:hypothetical protein